MAKSRRATATDLWRAYRKYNRIYFNNKLPSLRYIDVNWGRMRGLGVQDGDIIRINDQFKWWESIWKMTLLHEMVHLITPGKEIHGPAFQKEMRRLAKIGAFKHMW